MGLKQKLATTTTARRKNVTIEPFGGVLFSEPSLSELQEAQRKHMVYTLVQKGKEATAQMDMQKSNLPAYNRALVALTVRDPETNERVFDGEKDVSDTFSLPDESGAPRHGSTVFNEFVTHANEVCGLVPKDGEDPAGN